MKKMRRYKKRKRKYRKRRYWKKRRPWRSKISWRKMPRQFPDKISVKLKYFSAVRSQPPGTQAVERAYRLNGCNNVDVQTNIGKPNTFLNWATLYEKYQVKASSIKVNIFNIDTTDIVFCYVIPVDASRSTVGTFPTYVEACEFPYTSNRVITSARAKQQNVMTNFISMRKLTGRTIVDEDFTASTVANAPADNPLDSYYWDILFSADTTQDLNIYFEITIMYYITFYNRRIIKPEN